MSGKGVSSSSVSARNRLSAERHRRGWSQQFMADRIGTTPLNISRWERGLTRPSPYFSYKLCALFDLTAEELELTSTVVETETRTGREQQEASVAPMYDPVIPLLAAMMPLVGREREMEHLKSSLVGGQPATVVALTGLPGIGKTALTLAMVYDMRIREAMSGGILWAALGPRPGILSLLRHWGDLLGVDVPDATGADQAEAWMRALRRAIGQRKMLIVLDDVWQLEHALACMVGGPRCVYLITTRFPPHALALAANSTITLGDLDEEQSLALLRKRAPEVVAQEPEQVRLLARAVGGLPLALVLIGSYLHLQSHDRQPRRIQAAIRYVQQARERLQLSALQSPLECSPSRPGSTITLQAVIAMSDQQLGERAREALRSLSILPAKPACFSEAAALAVCQESAEILDELSDAGLIGSVNPGYYLLHRTIADYACLHLTSTAPIERLIAYAVDYAERHSEVYAELELERDTILAALEAAYEQRKTADLIRGVLAFLPFLHAQGFVLLATYHAQHAYELASAAHAPQVGALRHWLARLAGDSEENHEKAM